MAASTMTFPIRTILPLERLSLFYYFPKSDRSVRRFHYQKLISASVEEMSSPHGKKLSGRFEAAPHAVSLYSADN